MGNEPSKEDAMEKQTEETMTGSDDNGTSPSSLELVAWSENPEGGLRLPRDELPEKLNRVHAPLELWQETYDGLEELFQQEAEYVVKAMGDGLDLALELAKDMEQRMATTERRLNSIPCPIKCLCCCCILCVVPCCMMCQAKQAAKQIEKDAIVFYQELEQEARALQDAWATFLEQLRAAYRPLGVTLVEPVTRDYKDKNGKTCQQVMGLRFTSETGFQPRQRSLDDNDDDNNTKDKIDQNDNGDVKVQEALEDFLEYRRRTKAAAAAKKADPEAEEKMNMERE